MMPNISKKKKRLAAALSALVMGALTLLLALGMLWAMAGNASMADAVIAGACAAMFVAMAVGIMIALRQRWREIGKGEEDEAGKY